MKLLFVCFGLLAVSYMSYARSYDDYYDKGYSRKVRSIENAEDLNQAITNAINLGNEKFGKFVRVNKTTYCLYSDKNVLEKLTNNIFGNIKNKCPQENIYTHYTCDENDECVFHLDTWCFILLVILLLVMIVGAVSQLVNCLCCKFGRR